MKSSVIGFVLKFELFSADELEEDRDGLRTGTLLSIALKTNIAGKTL